MKRLDPLTSIRFFAALLVVFAHVNETYKPFIPTWMNNFMDNGYVGVNLFFVLSGFILTYNYLNRFQQQSVTGRQFFVARFARLYPVFFFALVATLPKLIHELHGPDKPSLVGMALCHLTLTHAWFPSMGNQWIGPAWSISTEFFFYLAFPFLIGPLARLKSRHIWAMMLVVFALSCVLPILYSTGKLDGVIQVVGDREFVNRAIRWWPIFRIPEFIIGALFCRLYMDRTLLPQGFKVSFLGWFSAATLICMFVLMSFHNLLPMLIVNQVLLTIPFGIMIWYLAYEQGWISKVLSWQPLVLLGEASYSLYMLHIGMLYVLDLIFQRTIHVGRSSPLAMSLMIPLVFLGSIVAFKLIEVPSRRWIVKRYSGAPKQVRDSVELAAEGALSQPEAEDALGVGGTDNSR